MVFSRYDGGLYVIAVLVDTTHLDQFIEVVQVRCRGIDIDKADTVQHRVLDTQAPSYKIEHVDPRILANDRSQFRNPRYFEISVRKLGLITEG